MENNTPLISIILPVYNVEEYLSDCINSVIKQTYSKIEIIIVDDGSNKRCSDLCDSYKQIDNRVVVFHKTNGGISDARNYGIEMATGEYITYIDPDDYVDEDYIEYLLALLRKYDTKMSICQHRYRYKKRITKDYGNSGDECLSPKICIEKMLYHDIIDTSVWAKLYHKSLFENIKYPKGWLFEDIATTYALMMLCTKIAVGYESKYNYIYRCNSITNSTFKPGKLDLLDMTDSMAENVLKVYPDLEKAVMRRRVYARFSTLNQMLYTKGYDKERSDMINFIKLNGRGVFLNSKTPVRDKFAYILLCTNYKWYCFFWKIYFKCRIV